MQGYLRAPAPGLTVEELLRHALRDPSVRVAFWVDDRRQWVCADGRPAPAPSAHPGVDRIDAHHHDRPVARVCFDPDRVDRQLVQAAVAEAIGELDNVGLRAAVALQLVEAQQSRARIAAAQQQERRRIERNLHDGAQQRLLALALQLQAAQVNGDPARLRDTVGTSIAQLQTAMTELRELANGLHPAVLSDGGLAAALDDLAERVPVPIEVRADEERFTPEIEATAWFIACEAIANAVKHANAALITVEVSRRDGQVLVAVSDDGAGGADATGHGLRGIADRAEAAGGSFDVHPRQGGGTTVSAELPCGS